MLFSETEVERHGKGTELVVLLHGFGGKHTLRDLRSAVTDASPNSDVFIPKYKVGPFRNTDIRQLSGTLEQYIDECFRKRAAETDRGADQYRKVILIGHSLGTLIIRKAYIYGKGSTEDHPIPRSNATPSDWVAAVERIVLLAGMNRGWSFHIRPTHMSFVRWIVILLWHRLVRLTGTGRLVRGAQRGSPFVSNLRIQWIRLTWSPVPLAPVFQLLGGVDDIVEKGDSRDLSAAASFTFIPVLESDHLSIARFDDTPVGRRRKSAFTEALAQSVTRLQSRYRAETASVKEGQHEKRREHLVFILHGIRDIGGWRSGIEKSIKALNPAVDVKRPGYKYMPMLPFLFIGARQKYVRDFVDWYTEELARYPRTKISIFGHSNGTYIAANALRKYQAIRLHRIAFAGSVLPRAFPWDSIIREQHRATAVLNYLASADWVVAIFPRLLELVTEITGFRRLGFGDIGTGGFNGFQESSGNEKEIRYVRGTHSAALKSVHHASIAEFLVNGKVRSDENALVKKQSLAVVLSSKLCWLIWIALAAAPVALGWFLIPYLTNLLSVSPLLVGLGYAGLLLLLLYTI